MIEALAALAKIGIGGGVGFLVGVAVVTWVKPDTDAGRGILIAICVVVFAIIGNLLPFKKTQKPDYYEEE
jgi:ABC-type antimicrobial peptide transport system permease subunit